MLPCISHNWRGYESNGSVCVYNSMDYVDSEIALNIEFDFLFVGHYKLSKHMKK